MPFGYRLEQAGQCHITFDKNVHILIKVSTYKSNFSQRVVYFICF